MSINPEFRKQFLEILNGNLIIERAQGHYLYDENGKQYLDCLAQYGAVAFGHNDERFIEETRAYFASNAPIFVQPFSHQPHNTLTAQLLEHIPGDYAYVKYANSGTEAVELALKAARFKTNRLNVMSVIDSFHGKTFASLSASGSERYATQCTKDRAHYEAVDLTNIEHITQRLESKTFAAFIFEPILGEGGMRAIDAQVIQHIAAICKRTGTLLIADEIQTGLGRCGELILSPTLGVSPDIVCLSKSLSGGIVPVAAVLLNTRAYSVTFDQKHSSTFANNGLAMHCGSKTLERLLEDDSALLKHVNHVSTYVDSLISELHERFNDVVSITGAGLMRGIHFHIKQSNNNYIVEYGYRSGMLAYLISGFLLRHHHIIAMPLLSQDCALRFEPPLTIQPAEVDTFFNALADVVQLIKAERYDILFSHVIKRAVIRKPSDYQSNSHRLACLAPMHRDDASVTFAFLAHSTSEEDLIRSLPASVRNAFTLKECQQLVAKLFTLGELSPSPDIAVKFNVNNGKQSANGMIVFSPISPTGMLNMPKSVRKQFINDCFDIARAEGATLVGLGAYTSVITIGGTQFVDEHTDMQITTGNSLTAMSTIEVTKEKVEDRNTKSVAIIGSRGSVGRLNALFLSAEFGEVVLVSRPGTSNMAYSNLLTDLVNLMLDMPTLVQPGSALHWLRTLFNEANQAIEYFVADFLEMSTHKNSRIRISDEPEQVIAHVDCIISATSHGKPFLNPNFLKPGCVVIDAARPFDFTDVDKNHDIQLLEGGVVRQPQNTCYGDCNMVGLKAGFNLACISETIALALSGEKGNFSTGKIAPEQALQVMKIAKAQGFELTYTESDTENEHQALGVD